MTEIRVRRQSTNRLSLRLREAGQGRPIIFLHGITANAGVWDPIVEQLGSEHRAIAIDQRGHGGSDRPAPGAAGEGYRGADYAEDVISLTEALNEGPAIVVGHSLGARNAVVAGCLRPDLVRAVVAVDFTPFVEAAALDALAQRVSAGDRVFGSRGEVESYLRDRYPLLPADAIRRRAAHGYRESEEGLRPLADAAALTATAAGLRESFAAELERIEVPTVLVRGAESRLVSRPAFDAARALRPDIPAVEVPWTDHYVPEENPGAMVVLIRALLAGLPA